MKKNEISMRVQGNILSFKSPGGTSIKVKLVEHLGGASDSGGWIIKTESGEVFYANIGRDVFDSDILKGGEIIERIDTERHTEKDIKKKLQEYIKKYQKPS